VRIALIAPPFISVPPKQYGGTELFIAQLALGLKRQGHDVTLYATGDSTLPVQVKSIYPKSDWPIKGEIFDNYKDVTHNGWAVRDASDYADVIHLNGAPGIVLSRFVKQPVVYTVHHAFEQNLTDYYLAHPRVTYVCISNYQREQLRVPNARAIHHGVDTKQYRLTKRKQNYLSFLGRLAPVKGAHLAIEVSKKSGIPLKIAGQIQPLFQSYFDAEIKPHIDGKHIEYVGEADHAAKNELLGNSLAMLFPIQWHEPFGLVMVESMACGTPVLALPGGSVAEVVKPGVSGTICGSVDELADAAKSASFDAAEVRRYVENNFSLDRMVTHYIGLYEELIHGRPKVVPSKVVA